MPLASGMKDKLTRRDEIDLPNRKANEYNIRQYIKKHLKDIDEILWALDQLPTSQLDKLFSGEDIMRLQKLEEKVIEHVSIQAVEGDKVVYRFNVKGDIGGFKEIMKNATAIIKVTLPAKNEEIGLIDHITDHAEFLKDSIKNVSHKDKNVYSLKEFDSKVLRNIANIAVKRGQAYHIEPIFESATAWIEKEPEEEPPK